MLDPRFFDEFTDRLMGLLPPGAAELREDFQKNLRNSVQAMFSNLELVTREEFDVQAAVLRRAREQLDALEQRVGELEARLQAPPPD